MNGKRQRIHVNLLLLLLLLKIEREREIDRGSIDLIEDGIEKKRMLNDKCEMWQMIINSLNYQ